MENPTTPSSLNDNILKFCKEIDSTTNPVFVEVVPTKDSIYNECYGNVALHIKRNGGEVQYGWIIWEIPNIYLEGEFHAVWINDERKYVDITPRKDGEKNILFLKDSKRKFTGEELVDNIRKPLIDNDFTRQLVKISKENFEINNQRYKEKKAKFEKLGRNEFCLCGSGRKYKKCCIIRFAIP